MRAQQGATRWERFKRWLKEKFEGAPRTTRRARSSKWSRQFRTSEGVARALTYLGYAMVLALVLFVIVSELRAAGWLGAARRAAARADPAAEWRRRLMLADVIAAPLAERPGMLLRLLGEALTRAHRLPAAEGLTAGAIARRAELETADERAELERIAATSEQIRYAERRPGDAALEGDGERRARIAREVRAPVGANADARARHHLPARAGRARRVLRAVVAARRRRSIPTRTPRARPARSAAATVTRGSTTGSRIPGSRCARSASATPTLPDLDLPSRGNLLMLSLPGVEVFHSDEFGALDKWVRRGQHAADQRRAARSAGLGGGARVRRRWSRSNR